MSSISALQVPGLGTILPAKPDSGVSVQASTIAASATAPPTTSSYPSPKFALDPLLNQVIIEYRNVTTGDVTQQFPPKGVARLYEQSSSQTASPATHSGFGTA
jgi:hypothetical protein